MDGVLAFCVNAAGVFILLTTGFGETGGDTGLVVSILCTACFTRLGEVGGEVEGDVEEEDFLAVDVVSIFGLDGEGAFTCFVCSFS